MAIVLFLICVSLGYSGYGHQVKYRHQDDVVQSSQEQTAFDLEAEFRYSYLPSEELDLVDRLFRGKLQFDELPGGKSKVVKLFISSTFTGNTAYSRDRPG